mmetsp:Transcript_14783/g.26151  ORF Transcript_14783/g.26151 Transcript_14783/m.26151 type:complete len:309 (-) Transcript_14783:164-1090(-)
MNNPLPQLPSAPPARNKRHCRQHAHLLLSVLSPTQHCFPQLGEDHCEVGGGDEERLLRFHHRPLRVLLLLPRRLRHASLVSGGVMLPLLLPHALLLHLTTEHCVLVRPPALRFAVNISQHHASRCRHPTGGLLPKPALPRRQPLRWRNCRIAGDHGAPRHVQPSLIPCGCALKLPAGVRALARAHRVSRHYGRAGARRQTRTTLSPLPAAASKSVIDLQRIPTRHGQRAHDLHRQFIHPPMVHTSAYCQSRLKLLAAIRCDGFVEHHAASWVGAHIRQSHVQPLLQREPLLRPVPFVAHPLLPNRRFL